MYKSMVQKVRPRQDLHSQRGLNASAVLCDAYGPCFNGTANDSRQP